MSEFKVFYAWQSDLPNATNRGFIQDALAKACSEIANNPEIEESPRVDQDTKDLPGSPLIPAAIMQKIDECQAFIADASQCFTGPKSKVAPNPNVLYELGYAVARLGWDRVTLVVNENYGPVESLPFDIEKRRAIKYTAKEGETDRSEAKKALVGALASNIALIARRQPIVPRRTPADIAIEAIENQSPARHARLREFWSWVMSELRRLEPDLRSMQPKLNDTTEIVFALKEAVTATTDLVREWSLVCEAIALSADEESADMLIRSFESIYSEYDHKPGWPGGQFYEWWFDFWRFLGHELYTVWIAVLLRERRWRLIDTSLNATFFHQPRQEVRAFDRISDHVRLLLADSEKSKRVSVHAELLKQRYEQGGVGSTVTHQEFMCGDLFLYFAANSRLAKGLRGYSIWRPWSVLYLTQPPLFLLEARRHSIAAYLKATLRQTDSDETRKILADANDVLGQVFPRASFWTSPIDARTIEAFDTLD